MLKNLPYPFRAFVVATQTLSVMVALVFGANLHAEEARMYTYTTIKGDNLRNIAKKQLIVGSNWQLLQTTNQLKNPDAIATGSRIKIPVEAMRMEPALVKVLSVQGTAESNGGAIKIGANVSEGSKISTGDDGFVTLQLADGSTLTVQSKSSLRLENTRQFANASGVTDSIIRLDSGRVETNVAKQRNSGGRYEIRTPTSNMGVRGTVFRVAADGSGERASSEVLEGRVAVTAVATAGGNTSAPNPKSAEVALDKGYGTVAAANKPPLLPIELLPAPAMTALASRLNNTGIEFKFSAMARTVKYRGQLARDQAFKNPVADVVGEVVAGEVKIRFAALPAGEYFLRVRAIDGLGLEGNNGEHTFAVVKPLAAPLQNAQVSGAKFAWSAVDGADKYRLQISSDENFHTLLLDESTLAAPSFSPVNALGPGNYFWRVSAIDKGGVEGIVSAGQNLVIQGPTVPLDPPQVDDARVTLSWQGNLSQLYQIQIARDERFHDIVVNNRITGNTFAVDAVKKGFYFARVRAVAVSADAQIVDGITPWSEIRSFDVFTEPLNLTPLR